MTNQDIEALQALSLFVLFAVILTAVGLAIGARRNRHVAGMLFGFFLGPIGWLLLLIGPDYRPRCPACRAVVDPQASICRFCSTALR